MERRHWNHSTYPTTSSTSYDHATTRSSGSTTELSSTSSQGDSGGTGQGSTEVTSISAPAPTLSSSSRRSLSSTLSSMAQSSISAPSSSIASLSNGTIGGFQDKLVVGQRGFDAASAGMVSTAILGFIVAGGLLYIFNLLSKPRYKQELVAPRLFFVKDEAKPPPLPSSKLAWFFPFFPFYRPKTRGGIKNPNAPTFFPRFPDGNGNGRWLSDAELYVRTLSLMSLIAFGIAVLGLGIALPLFVMGVPSLSSEVYNLGSGSSGDVVRRLGKRATEEVALGTYSTVDDLTILRLLHAFDLEKTGTIVVKGLSAYYRILIVLVIVLVVPPLLILPILYFELTKAEKHLSDFRNSNQGGSGCEIGFLRVDNSIWKKRLSSNGNWWRSTSPRARTESNSTRSSGLEGLGEARLREVFRLCGLGPEEDLEKRSGAGGRLRARRPSRLNEEEVRYAGLEEVDDLDVPPTTKREVCVAAVYSVPDLTHLHQLEERRRKIVDALEESECLYIACFEPAAKASSGLRSKFPTKFKSKRKSRSKYNQQENEPKITSFGPSGHYNLTQRGGPSSSKSTTLNPPTTLQDAVGRQFGGASFLEVGLEDRRERDEFELGDRLRINDEGRWSRALTSTPGPTKVRFTPGGQDDEHEGEEEDSNNGTEVLATSGNDGTSTLSSPFTIKVPPETPSPPLLEGTIAFSSSSTSSTPPPGGRPATPRQHETGFGGLAMLSESEDEDDEDDAHTARYPYGNYSEDPSPSGWTDLTTHGRSGTAGSTNAPSTSTASTLLELPSHQRWSTIGSSIDEQDGEKTPNLDEIPNMETDSDEDVHRGRATTLVMLEAPPAGHRRPPLLPSTSAETTATSKDSFSPRKLHKPPPLSTQHLEEDEEEYVVLTPLRQHFEPRLRVASSVADSKQLSEIYADVRKYRAELRHINNEISELQTLALSDIGDGKTVRAFILVGKRVTAISGVEPIIGRTIDDIRWTHLFDRESQAGGRRFWLLWIVMTIFFSLLAAVPITLSVSNSPLVSDEWTFLQPYQRAGKWETGLVTSTVASLLLVLLIAIASFTTLHLAYSSTPLSKSGAQLSALKGTIYVSGFLLPLGIVMFGAFVASSWSLKEDRRISQALADGVPLACWLLLSLGVISVFLVPLCHLVRPAQAWKSSRNLVRAKTPRQRYLALRPTSDPPSYVFTFSFVALSTLSLVFAIAPLVVAPLVVLLFFSTLVARYSAAYVTSRSPETNGVFIITILRRIGFFLVFPPLLFGTLLLSRRLFAFAGASFGVSGVISVFLAGYFWLKRDPPLSGSTLRALAAFDLGAREGSLTEEGGSRTASRTSLMGRRSMSSVFDLVNKISQDESTPPPLPLDSETVDPYLLPEQATRLHANARPELPALPFIQQARAQNLRTLYPPVLVTGRPILMLPDDPLAREEARELEEFWNIRSVCEGAPPLHDLPALGVLRREESRQTQSNVHPWGSNAVKP